MIKTNEKEILDIYRNALVNTLIYGPAMASNLMDRLVYGYVNKVIEEAEDYFIVENVNAPYNSASVQRQYKFMLKPSATQEHLRKIVSIIQIN